MIQQLLQALAASPNEAADDVLVEALGLGNPTEQAQVLAALLKRQTVRGLGGVIGLYAALPDALKLTVLENIRAFHSALREAGRSDDVTRRLAALKLIALGRQGKLAYVVSENLHELDETLSKAAVEATVALARWVSTETRSLVRLADAERAAAYATLNENRPEIEAAVARAMDVHRGKHGPDLLRAALLLSDHPGSKTLAILHTAKHGGQSPMVRRLQQPPASEHVEGFLLGASHGQLRSHFGIVFSHIDEAPVLDALLRKTHWLKDHQLGLCMHQVTRGTWFGETELAHDIERRGAEDAARVGDWVAASGAHDVVQDQRLDRLREHVSGPEPAHFAARLRLLRLAARRPRGASCQLLRSFLTDPDERLVRLAAREIVRRRPADFENMLLQLMTGAPESVRRVVSRAIGQAGFENFWHRFDRLDKSTRKSAGRAMLKMLPDAVQRLQRRLAAGAIPDRLKAMQMAQELGLAELLRPTILQLCTDVNAKVRSKAVGIVGGLNEAPADILLERVMNDSDPRVRANAIEVLESKHRTNFMPMLAQRARSTSSRERANAIKALHTMKVKAATTALGHMLKDPRAEHRISGMWALRAIGWWGMLNEVGRLAKEDQNLRVRRYALGVLRNVSEMVKASKKAG
ncbi:MAG TPA: HEAT repeat domain-containing protein [Tepidisphaeraceae bacterium]|nr:HEAT repeat domain-containing protein [Tepidisphaeraceae bacterium]